MEIPERIPGLKVATLLLVLYAAAWIALEGSLERVLLLAVGIAGVTLGHGLQQMGGRTFSPAGWVAFAGFLGVALAVGSTVLVLLLMALKTGLHAHGPEFSTGEIGWVLAQFPWWTAGGVVGGLGMGLITLGVQGEGSRRE